MIAQILNFALPLIFGVLSAGGLHFYTKFHRKLFSYDDLLKINEGILKSKTHTPNKYLSYLKVESLYFKIDNNFKISTHDAVMLRSFKNKQYQKLLTYIRTSLVLFTLQCFIMGTSSLLKPPQEVITKNEIGMKMLIILATLMFIGQLIRQSVSEFKASFQGLIDDYKYKEEKD